MELCFAMNGLYFCFMLDRCLYFSVSAYAALKNEHRDSFKQQNVHWPLSQCHTSCNVTMQIPYEKNSIYLANKEVLVVYY